MRTPTERVGGVLGLLACLLLATVIAVVVPDPSTDVRRRYDDAKVGAVAATDVVQVRVTGVHLTRSAQGDYGDPWVSDLALVVVSVEAQARQRKTLFSQVVLRTSSERDYEPRGEFISAALSETQPGFTRSSTLVFEVPPTGVPDARLVIDPDSSAFDAYAAAIRIDLGLHAPLSLEPGPVAVPRSTVRVT